MPTRGSKATATMPSTTRTGHGEDPPAAFEVHENREQEEKHPHRTWVEASPDQPRQIDGFGRAMPADKFREHLAIGRRC